MLKKEDILAALRAVKAPGSKESIVDQNQIDQIDVREESILIVLKVPDLSPLVEKSLRFQIDSAIKKLSSTAQLAIEFKALNKAPSTPIPTLFAVGSGKGGVGKSSVAANLAIAFQKLGYQVGVLDCDIYGPSIPTMMGVEGQKPMMMDSKIQPIESHGLKIMSAGFFIEPGQSLVWRGPMIHKLIQQFIHDVDWKNLDILIIDLPPGTGDAPLSLAQTIPLTGAVMVSMPQQVSIIDVHKGISMFQQVKVPVLGVIENMSHFVCPSCQHVEAIFDRGGVKNFCRDLGVSYLGDIPIDPSIRATADQGKPFLIEHENSEAGKALMNIARRLQPFVRTHEDSAQDQIKLVL